MSEVSGGGEELSCIRDQGQWPGEATLRPRPGAVTLKSHPEPEARGGSWEEPPHTRGHAYGPNGNGWRNPAGIGQYRGR